MRDRLLERLAEVVGTAHCFSEPAQLKTYECDGLTSVKALPRVVVLPASTEEVARVVRAAREHGAAIVPRGAGTGLSGGAVAVEGCVMIGLSRLRRVLEVDLDSGFVRVEAGVVNLDVSRRLAADGYYYAPDPSSQSVCTIGGNVAENSGGAHCLKYGFTVNHVLGAKLVLSDGEIVELGSSALDVPGYDLLGVLVGSEGTMGIVTEVTLRVLRAPRASRTLFATFPSAEAAGAAVSAIIAAGVLPAAIEMMDGLAIEAIKAATGVAWPDVPAALLIELDGPSAEVEEAALRAQRLAGSAGALEIQRPASDEERQLMWKGRKSAFGAMGRISPDYLVQDGVIPRSEIARTLREIAELSGRAGLRVANVFHAGDGNLHPLILYDRRVPGQLERAERLGGEILSLCVRLGGSITGEHGVGLDKPRYLAEMFGDADLETMASVRCAFDPESRFNPGKVFPTPRLCGVRAGPYAPSPAERAGQAGRG